MENRFSIKDLFMFVMLFVIAGLVILGMVQFDRQYDRIKELKNEVGAVTNDLNTIRVQLASGIVVGSNSSSGEQREDPFTSLKEAKEKPDFAIGDWLVENFGTNIGKLTPLISTDVYATWVQVKVMESLAYRDPETLKYKPLLATHWDVSEDGRTMTFYIRKGVVFSDGTPMTAHDFVFTIGHILNPKIEAQRSASYYKQIESYEAVNDHELKVVWKEFVFNGFETIASTLVMPKHFYEKYTESQYNELPGLLMGTGPYRLPAPDTWTPGEGTVQLVRNERYWGERPAFDRLVYHQVKDDVAEETMYRNRELDRYAATPDSFEKLRNDKSITDRSHVLDYYSPVSGYTYIGWNQKKKKGDEWVDSIFADKRVRQAMTMLIDREQLAQDLYFGHAQAATGPFGYGSPQTDPDIKPWPYDPERAVKQLADAGWNSKNPDGIITRSDGTPLEFTLSYPSGNPFTDRIVLYLKDSYARVGIKMNLDAIDWPIFTKRLDTRDFEACTLGWSTSIETDANQIFSSEQTKNNGDNFVNYTSDATDAAIKKAHSTVNEEQRMQAWREVHALIHEDQPYTFLLLRQSLVFADSRIQNIKKTKMGLNVVNTYLMPLPWYVPADQQLHKTQ